MNYESGNFENEFSHRNSTFTNQIPFSFHCAWMKLVNFVIFVLGVVAIVREKSTWISTIFSFHLAMQAEQIPLYFALEHILTHSFYKLFVHLLRYKQIKISVFVYNAGSLAMDFHWVSFSVPPWISCKNVLWTVPRLLSAKKSKSIGDPFSLFAIEEKPVVGPN